MDSESFPTSLQSNVGQKDKESTHGYTKSDMVFCRLPPRLADKKPSHSVASFAVDSMVWHVPPHWGGAGGRGPHVRLLVVTIR